MKNRTGYIVTTLRLPIRLHRSLVKKAALSHRSAHSEMLWRIANSLSVGAISPLDLEMTTAEVNAELRHVTARLKALHQAGK